WLPVLPPTLLWWLPVLPPTLLLPLIAVFRRLARTCHDVLLTVPFRARARLFCTTKTPQAASSASAAPATLVAGPVGTTARLVSVVDPWTRKNTATVPIAPAEQPAKTAATR